MKKTNFRKATLSALLMLVVAVVSLTGVTYAWFTSETKADVTNIEVTVTGTAGGLQIGTDYNFGNSVNLNVKGTYAPVSTAGIIKSATANGTKQQLQFFTATVGDNSKKITNIQEVTGQEVTGQYVEQILYFNNMGGKAKEIKFFGTVNAITKDSQTNANIDKGQTAAALATRLAIIVNGYTTSPEDVDTDQYSKFDGETTVKIYEPNGTQHTAAGKLEASLDGVNADVVNSISNPYRYYGIKAKTENTSDQISKYLTTDNQKYLQEVETESFASVAGDPTFEIKENAITRITLYIWVEGQDHDCHNDIAGTTFAATLSFQCVDKQ